MFKEPKTYSQWVQYIINTMFSLVGIFFLAGGRILHIDIVQRVQLGRTIENVKKLFTILE